MDETPVLCDIISESTIDATGKRSITLAFTSQKKARVSVCLAAKTSGTKLKLMVVFRDAKQEAKNSNSEQLSQLANAWMDTGLTKVWIDSVLGSFSFNFRLLARDSFECDIEDSITHALQSKKIDRIIVPGWCTKYIQALDICWNIIQGCWHWKVWWMVGYCGNSRRNSCESTPEKNHFAVYSWFLSRATHRGHQKIFLKVHVEPSYGRVKRQHDSLSQGRTAL